MPIAFMFLLVWLKTLSTQYSSPSIAYTCGQTYPWNYAGSTSSEDAAKLLQCNIQPAECTDEVRLETVLLVYSRFVVVSLNQLTRTLLFRTTT